MDSVIGLNLNLIQVNQGSPTLVLEIYCPADFRCNPAPTHLNKMTEFHHVIDLKAWGRWEVQLDKHVYPFNMMETVPSCTAWCFHCCLSLYFSINLIFALINRICPDGVDIVLDCLCGENTGKSLSLLKPLGTYILYGTIGQCLSIFSMCDTCKGGFTNIVLLNECRSQLKNT